MSSTQEIQGAPIVCFRIAFNEAEVQIYCQTCFVHTRLLRLEGQLKLESLPFKFLEET